MRKSAIDEPIIFEQAGREYGKDGNNGTNGNLQVDFRYFFPFVPLFPSFPYLDKVTFRRSFKRTPNG